MTMTAQVFDVAPAQFRRMTKTRRTEERAAASIIDDLADGIEAVHQLSNLAGFSERPRAFIFALATAAHRTGDDFIELFDEELAKLQGCSTRTVRRQRKDYLRESRARRFGFVEVIEGDYDKGSNQNAPTRYRFHVGGQIAEAVELARRSEGWPEMSRQKQREAIARACEEVFHTIPDARRQGRKDRRTRPATAEIESRLKTAETNLDAARELASKLSDSARAELVEEGSELHARLLRMRAEIDQLLAEASPQAIDTLEVDRGLGQLVRTPLVVSAPAPAPEPSDADVAAWEAIERRAAGVPHVVSREVQLRPPPAESPPVESVEDEEAEAIRLEGCGGL